jgi:hypothetical protein
MPPPPSEVSEDPDELARTNAALLSPGASAYEQQSHSEDPLYGTQTEMGATHAAVAIPRDPNHPFATAESIPESVELWTSDDPDAHGGFRRRQRINPVAYATIAGALLITVACIVMQMDILPHHVFFTYAKLLASPFSNIFATAMTFLFNDMHGFDVTYDAGNGTFEAKRFTVLTQCCGPRIRTFAATDVYGLSIVYPCGCPDRAVLVFETTKGDIPIARQAGRCCRCDVEDLTVEAEFWVRMCQKQGVATEFFGVKTNKFLPAMF